MKILFRAFLLFTLLFSFSSTFAATIESTTSGGNWSDTATWSGAVVPSSASDVIIRGPISLDGNKSIVGLEVAGGGSIQRIVGSSTSVFTLTVNGPTQVDGGLGDNSFGLNTNKISFQLNDDVTNNGVIAGLQLITIQGDFHNNGTINSIFSGPFRLHEDFINSASASCSPSLLVGSVSGRQLIASSGCNQLTLDRDITTIGDFLDWDVFLKGYTLNVDTTQNIHIKSVDGSNGTSGTNPPSTLTALPNGNGKTLIIDGKLSETATNYENIFVGELGIRTSGRNIFISEFINGSLINFENINIDGDVRVIGASNVTGKVTVFPSKRLSNFGIFPNSSLGVFGDLVNQGYLGAISTAGNGNSITLSINGNFKNQGAVQQLDAIKVRGHFENTSGSFYASTPYFATWEVNTQYHPNYLFFLSNQGPDGVVASTNEYQIANSNLFGTELLWFAVGTNLTEHSPPLPTRCINVPGCIDNGVPGGWEGGGNGGGDFQTLYNIYKTISQNNLTQNVLDTKYPIVDVDHPGDPINLFSGEFTYDNSVMSYPAEEFPFDFKLTYANQVGYPGPLGTNWDHSYNLSLDVTESGSILYHDGKLGTFEFIQDGGLFEYNADLQANLTQNTDDTFTLAFVDGMTYNFNAANVLASAHDRYNNTVTLTYDNDGKLTNIVDTLGRNYILTYTGDGHIGTLTSFAGESVEFEYFQTTQTDGNQGDLKTIHLHNGTEQKQISFTYTIGDSEDDPPHNILTLTDANNQVYVTNTYAGNRVSTQTYGTGTLEYEYTVDEESHKVTTNQVTDKEGNAATYSFDTMGNVTQKVLATTSGNVTTNYEYNSHGWVTREELPLGNGYTYTYDDNRNVIEKRFKQDVDAANSASDIVTTSTYNLNFNVPTSITYPDGRTVNLTLDIKGRITRALSSTIENGSSDFVEDIHYTYDTNGYLASMTDSEGIVTLYTYTNGLLTQKQTGAQIDHYAYDSKGNIQTVTDALGNITAITSDTFHRITQETSPEGVIKKYQYDANNNLTSAGKMLSSTLVNITAQYDILDNPIKTIEKISATQNASTRYVYDKNEKVTKVTSPNGLIENYVYDELSRVTQKTTVWNSQTTTENFTYDKNNNLLTQSKNATVYTFAYDLFDRLVSATDPLGNSALYTYDKLGNITQVEVKNASNTLLSKTQYVWNGLSLLLQEKKYNGISFVTEASTYNKNGQIVSSTDVLGNTTTYAYESLRRLSTTTLPNGLQAKNTYDLKNRITKKEIISTTPVKTLSTRYTYDDDDRVIEEKDDNNNTLLYTYNTLGQVLTMTDKKGTVTSYTYDFRGKVLTESVPVIPAQAGIPGTRIIHYTYDIAGNLTHLVDALGNDTSYTYDTMSHLLSETDDTNHTTTYTYNSRGNLASKTDANGTVIAYTYDNLDRLTAKNMTLASGVEGVTSESYSYDGLGRLVSSSDSQSNSIAFTYNTLGQLVSESNNGQTITYSYDSLGNILSTTYPSGKVITRTYDLLNRVLEIKNDTQTVANYSYDDLNLTQLTLGNSRTTTSTYDTLSRLQVLSHPEISSGSGRSYTFTYDPNSNITSNSIDTLTYDTLNQLTSVNYDKIYNSQYKGDKIKKYAYDLGGNRTALENYRLSSNLQEKEKRKDLYTTDTLNQYAQVTTQNKNDVVIKTKNYTYDDNGNLKTDDRYSYTYDYKNRLVKVANIQNNTTKATYTYDTLGRRLAKTSQNKAIRYTYSNQDAIDETYYTINANTQALTKKETREYIYGSQIDDVLEMRFTKWKKVSGQYQVDATSTYYYQKNQLGSITDISNTLGQVIESYEYDVYGTAFIRKNTTEAEEEEDEMRIDNIQYTKYKGEGLLNNTRLYTGREYDSEIHLYYMRARYYSPKLGRFISRDPIGIVDDINLYSYTGNNPVNWIDRNGKQKMFTQAYDSYLDLETKFESIQNTTACLTYQLSCSTVKQNLFFAEEYAKLLHYARNQFNVDLPQTMEEASTWGNYFDGWVVNSNFSARYHQFGVLDSEYNIKYTNLDGREVVYNYYTSLDESGNKVHQVTQNVNNIGTYNFFHPDLSNISNHQYYDVNPFIEWGNSANDTTTREQRAVFWPSR